ncbi:conserved hypothetical integral membrane protein [Mesorhizobium albiziae]|uniref:Conserved hypothetical integral membrane protein n=1 Tax=Neomesorhizobium albiziae TaxID=335020 RepID=A0A1I3VIP2_9HYPH|nr:conserved hypothetical integral membrane protein [Mesorhizobium albiziae]
MNAIAKIDLQHQAEAVAPAGIPCVASRPRPTAWIGRILPGLAFAATIAAAAYALRFTPGLSLFSPMIMAIVLGVSVRNVFGMPAWAKPGAAFAMRPVLRFAIILLGLQLTAAQIAEVGVSGIAIIVLTLATTFASTVWLGRLMGVERGLSELIAAGTSICGASAVIAANTVTRASDEDVAYAVACVTLFGSIAMFTYPLLAGFLELGPQQYGLWAGASIHEVAQVVAAAFQGGQAAGEFGTVAKLSRVMLLAPVVLGLGLACSRQNGGTATGMAPRPWFVLGFIALVGLNSVVAIPPGAKAVIATAATFMLSVALAAMGLETSVSRLRAKGLRPLLLGLVASLFIASFSLLLIKLI